MSANSTYFSLADENNEQQLKKKLTTTKRIAILSIILSIVLLIIVIILGIKLHNQQEESTKKIIFECPTPNIPIESIITPTIDIAVNHTITPNSAAAYNRTADYLKSPYYRIHNFFTTNPKEEISSTLLLLPNFQTYQQTSAYSCGAATGFMALRHLNLTNPSYNITEHDVAFLADTRPHIGTFTHNLAFALNELANPKDQPEEKNAMITYTENDGDLNWYEFINMIKDNIHNNAVMMVADVDWAGHWRCIIGYDDMGTEETADDVLILADPFDTTDHNQDGYVIQSAERFYSQWFISGLSFPEGHNYQQYVTVTPIVKK